MKLVTKCCLKKGKQKEIFVYQIHSSRSKFSYNENLRCALVSHTMVSCFNRHHLPLNSATYGWKKEDNVKVPFWFEGNALTSAEELAAISLGSVKIDNQELDVVAENESDIEDREDE